MIKSTEDVLKAHGFVRTGNRIEFIDSESPRPFLLNIQTGIFESDAYTIAVDGEGWLWRANHVVSIDDPRFAKPVGDEFVHLLSDLRSKMNRMKTIH